MKIINLADHSRPDTARLLKRLHHIATEATDPDNHAVAIRILADTMLDTACTLWDEAERRTQAANFEPPQGLLAGLSKLTDGGAA